MKYPKSVTEKYFRTKARELPLHECLINEDWKEKGLATILISKKQPSGNYLIAVYLVDIFCLGVKNAIFHFNMSEHEYEETKDKMFAQQPEIPCDIVFAHNLIYGAIDYAEELGFSPQKDFKIAEYALDPDLIDDGIDEIEFGKNGKPFYIAGPDDNVNRIIRTLERTVGEDNFNYLSPPRDIL